MDNAASLRTITVVRRIALVLSAAFVALLASSAAQAANPVVAAVERTTSARSSLVDMQVSTAVGSSTVLMRGSGAVRRGDVKMTVKTSTGGQFVAIDMIMLRRTGGYVMYMRSDALRAQLPGGKSWLELDLSKAAQQLGVDFTALLDSSKSLAPLERGVVSTRRLGRETVAGTPTTHYRVVVDVHRAARALPDYAKQVAAIERATGAKLGRTTQEVWIGSDGRIRRLRSTTPTVVQGTQGTSIQTLTYRGYDVPVTISAPPRSQVFSVG
jgi:hypothetical protein